MSDNGEAENKGERESTKREQQKANRQDQALLDKQGQQGPPYAPKENEEERTLLLRRMGLVLCDAICKHVGKK